MKKESVDFNEVEALNAAYILLSLNNLSSTPKRQPASLKQFQTENGKISSR